MTATPGRPADPARNYLFIGLAALLVVAAAVFTRPAANPLAAALPAAVGALGLIGRLTVMPVVFLLLLCYLLVFPLGLPAPEYLQAEYVRATHFRVTDLVLAAAVLVYLAAQYRLLTLAGSGKPPGAPPRAGSVVTRDARRPGALVAPDELGRLFAVLAACVVAGQLGWLVVSELRVDFRGRPPVVLPESLGLEGAANQYLAAPAVSRFVLLAGLCGAVGLGAGIVFWYWRLARLTPDEAGMILLDTQWSESRRELARQETWRARAANKRRPAADKPRAVRPGRGCAGVLLTVGLTIGVLVFLWVVAFCVLANLL